MILYGLPMSYSSNHQYTPVRGRLIKSKQSRDYAKQMDLYYLQNIKLINEVHETFKDISIQLDITFVFHISKVITKTGSFKKIDYSNRVKSFQDEFCRIIRIDDSAVKSGFNQLAICKKETDQQIIIQISPQQFIRTYNKESGLDWTQIKNIKDFLQK